MIRILAACSPGEIRAAAVENGELLDYAIHRPGAPPGLRDDMGDRLRGRVIAHVPAMAGAFIALPGAEGFLPDSQGAAGLSQGDSVTVLVTRAAQGGKGPRLSARTPQAEPGPPALLAPGPDAIARLLALHPGAEIVVDDPAIAPGQATIVTRAWTDDIATAIDALSSPALALPGGGRATIHPTPPPPAPLPRPALALPGGGRATIHPTPALVAIDIDTAGATADRRAKSAAQRAANVAALPALARAIRLRNLSGAIVVDLAGMAIKARAALAPAFAAALEPDPLHPRFLGFTALGLAEITRPRAHPPLHELLSGPHPAGLVALRHLMHAAAADPATAHRLRTHPDIVRALEADTVARAALARRTGRPLIMLSDPALPPGTCIMEPVPRG